MAKHDKISPEGDARIKELLLAGHSMSLVARITGVDPRSVGTRRAELKRSGAQFPKCQCGRSVSHTGMCSHRHKKWRDVPQTNFARGQTPRVTYYDSDAWDGHRRRIAAVPLPSPQSSGEELVRFVEKIIPKSSLPEIRDDLVQDILVALLSGTLKADAIAGALPKFARDLYAQFPTLGGAISLDDIVSSASTSVFERKKITVADFVADDRPSPEQQLLENDEDDFDETVEYVSNLQAMESGWHGGFVRRPQKTDEDSEFERKPVVAQAARSTNISGIGSRRFRLKLNPDHARDEVAHVPLKALSDHLETVAA